MHTTTYSPTLPQRQLNLAAIAMLLALIGLGVVASCDVTYDGSGGSGGGGGGALEFRSTK